jgi:hypothetical protein
MILAILLGMLVSLALITISLFADRVSSFRIKDREGNLVEVSRPRYASWIANLGMSLGFIGIVASLLAMFAYKNR